MAVAPVSVRTLFLGSGDFAVPILDALAGWLGYRWTQEQYYVGVDDERVAIYQGIPQSIAGFELSTVVETTDIEVADLPGFVRDRLDQTIPADDLRHARERAASLEPDPGA